MMNSMGCLLLALAGAGAWLAAGLLRGMSPAGAKWGAVAVTASTLLMALVVVGDSRILSILGYLPLLTLMAVGAVPGTIPGPDQLGPASLVHQSVLFLAAALWTMVAVRLSHRPQTGRTGGSISGFVLKYRVALTIAAAIIPAIYAVTRFAWAAGIPFGIQLEDAGQVLAGGGATSALGLATMATVGALLTLGLIQQWGRKWPRWVPALGGKAVPAGMAVAAACLVAMILVPAGTDMFRLALASPGSSGIPPFSWDNWAILGPNMGAPQKTEKIPR